MARRRLLFHPAPLDSGYWYRPKHAAPSLLIRMVRRLNLAREVARPFGYYERQAVVLAQWPRLSVVGIEATPARRAA